jgi:imidazoleglycerol-phosphate dehydratase
MRNTKLTRETKETKIKLNLNLDGEGASNIDTGIGFLDHMLDQLVYHSGVDLNLKIVGDIQIDSHHSVEDCGICLGKAFKSALGDKKGINRYGFFVLPMDDSLVRVALDFSGRPFLNWKVVFPNNRIGNFETELVREFFQAFTSNSQATLHIEKLDGFNSHHICEAIFKGFAKSLKIAISRDINNSDVPSTKGVL